MAKYPDIKADLQNLGGNFFSKEGDSNCMPQKIFGFHIGDVWRSVFSREVCMDFYANDKKLSNNYLPPEGDDLLREEIAKYVTRKTKILTTKHNILVSSGGTGAVANACGTVIDPGDEVLILSPHWPLIPGIVRTFCGIPIYVDFLLSLDSLSSIINLLEQKCTNKTTALYLNFPNNPTGKVLPRSWLVEIYRWASQKNLWVISDEAYNEFVYTGEHTYGWSLNQDRTFSAFSFSKSFGLAGFRCGFLVGPEKYIHDAKKINTHTAYGISSFSQFLMLSILQNTDESWLNETRKFYHQSALLTAEVLNLPLPDAGIYQFWNINSSNSNVGINSILKQCEKAGVRLAPGTIFGEYPDYVRLCFTTTQDILPGLITLSSVMDNQNRIL